MFYCPFISGPKPRLGQPLNTWECEKVTGVPTKVQREYGLSSFYRKYLHAYGIPIISSGRAQDAALRRACYVVVFVFADRQDIRGWFYRRRGRAGVIARDEGVTSIPEHSWLGSWWNQRARGLGATLAHPISTCTYKKEFFEFLCKHRPSDFFFFFPATNHCYLPSK